MSAGLAYAVYDRPLTEPFRYGNQSLDSRRGVLLRKTLPNVTYYSEASPLVSHSTDNFIEVLRALATRPAAELFETSASEHGKLPPSLRFALEGLVAQESPGAYVVTSNALLRWDGENVPGGQLARLAQAGYKVCKVKISPRGFLPLFDLLEANPAFKFRLDANGTLNPSLLTKLIEGLEKRRLLPRVEYLEEPFAGIWEKRSFKGSPLEFAADESAATPEAGERLFSAPNPPSVFIVKPTVAGGLFSIHEYLTTLHAARKKVVFTSAIESEPGRRSLIAFLSRGPHEAAGLSTGYLFRVNFMQDQSAWTGVPPPSEAELRFLSELAWKDCH